MYQRLQKISNKSDFGEKLEQKEGTKKTTPNPKKKPKEIHVYVKMQGKRTKP